MPDSACILVLEPEKVESLRRALAGWTLAPEDYANTDAILTCLGMPTQQPWDRLMISRGDWQKIVNVTHTVTPEPSEPNG